MTISKITWALALSFVSISFIPIGPIAAQQRRVAQSSQAYPEPTAGDELRTAATAINSRRSEYFRQHDAAGIASMYTQDATYVELLPRLQMMSGHAQIQQHFEEMFNAKATELRSTVVSAAMVTSDTQLVGGDYSLVAGGKQIMGHFVQTLRREDGVWRIASHIFARPDPVTAGEKDQYRGT
jgi:uncharacterized protein (TIGR02246 family)